MCYSIKLHNLLKKRLPGALAHEKMLTDYRRFVEQEFKIDQVKQSAVLVLLYPNENNRLCTLYTLRTSNIGVHSGQISFPGGRVEKGEENFEATALRETIEEVGVNSSDIQIVGKLTEIYIPRSGFNVHPFVGYCSKRPQFVIQPEEVELLIEIELKDLFDPSFKSELMINDNFGKTFKAPSYLIDNRHIWGATAMITSELEEVLSKEKF